MPVAVVAPPAVLMLVVLAVVAFPVFVKETMEQSFRAEPEFVEELSKFPRIQDFD